MVAESAEVDGTGQFITIGDKMTGLFILKPISLRSQLCSQRRRMEHKYGGQKVVE